MRVAPVAKGLPVTFSGDLFMDGPAIHPRRVSAVKCTPDYRRHQGLGVACEPPYLQGSYPFRLFPRFACFRCGRSRIALAFQHFCRGVHCNLIFNERCSVCFAAVVELYQVIHHAVNIK